MHEQLKVSLLHMSAFQDTRAQGKKMLMQCFKPSFLHQLYPVFPCFSTFVTFFAHSCPVYMTHNRM